MESLELEQRLKADKTSHIEFPLDSKDYVGSILVVKRYRGLLTLEDEEAKPGSNLYETIFTYSQKHPEDYAEAIKERRDVLARPITVIVMEIDRLAYEGSGYLGPKDFRRRDLYHFASVPEVDAFLHTLGYGIADLLAIPRLE
jgi:hypothetical protein